MLILNFRPCNSFEMSEYPCEYPALSIMKLPLSELSNLPANPPTIGKGALNWEMIAAQAEYKPSRVAKICGVSPRTMQRYFKKSFGCTLGEWLRAHRLKLAYEKIIGGSSIKSAALDLGYKQLSQFSRDFKKQFGCAPSFLERHS